MSSRRRLLNDVRSFGLSGALRAAYEASKRLGGHDLVFRRFVPPRSQVAAGRSPFVIPSIPEPVRDRTILSAQDILAGSVELFGRKVPLSGPPSWHDVIHTAGSWPATEWWRIDLRSDRRPGDVKWVWELGRQRHLVVLARAVHLEPGDARYLRTLELHLESWMKANPPEVGVHWYSNLEIALRAISWLQILALAENHLASRLTARMWQHLHHSGRHLIADLVYTVSTMRNNHLLGDALGLVALGSAFGGRTGRRWYTLGDRIFNSQLRRQMGPRGSMIEDSVSYHRFVLEMLAMRSILGGAEPAVREALERAAQFLARLGVLEGPVPQYGDWDEGRLLMVGENPSRLGGSARLALALAGSGAPGKWRESHDEVAWFVQEGDAVEPEPAMVGGGDLGAGIGRAERGPFTVWLKSGSGPSHGHADLTSVSISFAGQWLIGDPGTGAYNQSVAERDYFRSSRSHSVVRVTGVDQLVPHRTFRWAHRAVGVLGEPVWLDDATVMWAVHDAYTRLTPARRVARVVVVRSDGVWVTDHVEGPPTTATLTLPLHPAAQWDGDTRSVHIADQHFRVDLPPDASVTSARGMTQPFAGWWSKTYGTTEPATILDVRSMTQRPIRWGISVAHLPGPAQRSRGGGSPEVAIGFEKSCVRLRVQADGTTHLRSV